MHNFHNSEYHSAMRRHLRAGSTPALFEMDGLRLTELRHQAQHLEATGLAKDDHGKKLDTRAWSKDIVQWLTHAFAARRDVDVT